MDSISQDSIGYDRISFTKRVIVGEGGKVDGFIDM